LARFGTTFDFDHKYLKNRSWYRQSDTNFIESNFWCVGEKNLVNFCSDVDLPEFKIRCNFGQLQTLTANVSGADRYRKSITNLIDCHPSCIETKKFGELWSTNKQVAGANVDTP